MYLWNRNTIDKNIKLLKKIITMKKSTYDLNKIVFSLSSYKKVNEKLGDITDECYQQHFLSCPLVDDILDSNFCGHMHERSISFFHFIFNCKVIDIKNIMTHFQFNTHGTSPLAKDRFNQLYKNLF